MEASDEGATFTLALKHGIMLADRYRVDGVLADASSFAITYVATDEAARDPENASVVVKEFLPRILVARGHDGVIVQPHSLTAAREFSRALRRFLREGDTIAEMTNPNLIRVLRTLEANGTGYLVMQNRETVALTDALSDAGGKLPPAESVLLVQQLLGALEAVHAEGIFHRAISPASIAVMEGREILLHGY
jgi:serine/threonine protein kinase